MNAMRAASLMDKACGFYPQHRGSISRRRSNFIGGVMAGCPKCAAKMDQTNVPDILKPFSLYQE